MVFEGSVFFLSQKLTIPLTSKLLKLILAKGGTIAKDAKDPNTIVVTESWDPVRLQRVCFDFSCLAAGALSNAQTDPNLPSPFSCLIGL